VKQIRTRLTYANVMSSIAVFLILGGATAVAAKKIGTNEIKGNSITTGKIKKEAVTTSKIKKNAVTGAKIQLGTLGKVPSATNADHATSADTATTVGGSRIVTFNTPSGGTLFSLNGLTISCNPATGVATATTSAAGTINAVSIDTITSDDTDNRVFNVSLPAGGSTDVVGGGATEPDTVSQSVHVYYKNSSGNVVNADFTVVSLCNSYGVAYGS
jgi:hypothetical protein